MKVLLTGATGFIGSQVARALLAQGHEVRASIRAGRAKDAVADISDRIEWVTLDLFDADAAMARSPRSARGKSLLPLDGR